MTVTDMKMRCNANLALLCFYRYGNVYLPFRWLKEYLWLPSEMTLSKGYALPRFRWIDEYFGVSPDNGSSTQQSKQILGKQQEPIYRLLGNN